MVGLAGQGWDSVAPLQLAHVLAIVCMLKLNSILGDYTTMSCKRVGDYTTMSCKRVDLSLSINIVYVCTRLATTS